MSLCLIWILYGDSWSSFFKILCNDVCERLNSWECLQDFFGLLLTESLTASTLSVHLPARSGIFGPLVKIVYWPFGLKFVYPMINLAFLGIIVKLNFQRNFTCTVLNYFVSKSVTQIIFPLLSKAFWLRINCCYIILFPNLKQKKKHY